MELAWPEDDVNAHAQHDDDARTNNQIPVNTSDAGGDDGYGYGYGESDGDGDDDGCFDENDGYGHGHVHDDVDDDVDDDRLRLTWIKLICCPMVVRGGFSSVGIYRSPMKLEFESPFER